MRKQLGSGEMDTQVTNEQKLCTVVNNRACDAQATLPLDAAINAATLRHTMRPTVDAHPKHNRNAAPRNENNNILFC